MRSDVVKKAVKVPREFARFALAFQCELRKGVNDERVQIASALRHLDPNSRRIVKEFLTGVLSRNLDDKELQALWGATDGDYYIVPIRRFLTMIRDQVR